MAVIALPGNTIGCCVGAGSFESIGSSFKSAKQSVRSLAQGLSSLKSKIDTARAAANVDTSHTQAQNAEKREETKQSALTTGYSKLETLISDVDMVDADSAHKIRERKNDFYARYDYLKPDCEKTDKELKAEQRAEKWQQFKDFCSGVVEAVSNLIKSAIDWCKEHIGSILKLAISALIIVCLVAVVVLCPYTAPVFIATMGLIGAGTKIVTELYQTASEKGLDNMTFDDFANATFKGTVKGSASGIAKGIGLYYGSGARFVAGEFLDVGANLLINETDYFIDHGTLKGSTDKVLNAVAKGTFDNCIESAFFKLGSALGGKTPVNSMHNQILYGSKEMAVNKIISNKIGDIARNVAGSNATTIIQKGLKDNLNIPGIEDISDIIDISISGDGFVASIIDSVKGTLKNLLKTSLKPTEVY